MKISQLSCTEVEATVPTLQNAFSRLLWVSMASPSQEAQKCYDGTTLGGRTNASGTDCGQGHGHILISCVHCGKTNHLDDHCQATFGRPPLASVAVDSVSPSLPH